MKYSTFFRIQCFPDISFLKAQKIPSIGRLESTQLFAWTNEPGGAADAMQCNAASQTVFPPRAAPRAARILLLIQITLQYGYFE